MVKVSEIRASELSRRINWFINMRWIAIVGVITALNAVQLILKLDLPYKLLYLLSGILTISNIIYTALNGYIESKGSWRDNFSLINHFARTQIFIDLILLSLLLYGAGGIENPFIFFFVFHMLIASLLLSPQWAFIQATLAMLFFSSLVILSSYGVIPYYALSGFSGFSGQLVQPPMLYLGGRLLGLVSTVYILIFMSNSIVQHLNIKEEQLEKANEDLFRASEEKSRFILQVTHELRAPLAAMQSYLKVALEGYVGPIAGKLKEMLGKVSDRATNMLYMVNELLDFAGLKSPQKEALKKKHFDAQKFISKQLGLFQNELLQKRMILEKNIEAGVQFYADPEKLSILFANLVNNAIKYSEEDKKIFIKIQLIDKHTLLTIRDEGIGIPEKDLKNIFQEFYRTQKAVAKEKSGTGLGLAIVAEIVKKHQGKVWVESTPGQGSIFYVRLPNS